MTGTLHPATRTSERGALAGIAAVSAALLMTELALTRIFSVTMYYHFAFLAISIALFGLSASGVYVYVMRRTFDMRSSAGLLTTHSLLFAAATVLALAALVRIRVGLNYSHENLVKMIAIYALAALPFFTGGAVEWNAPSGLTLTGALTQSYSMKDDAVLDTLAIGSQRLDVTGGVARPLIQSKMSASGQWSRDIARSQPMRASRSRSRELSGVSSYAIFCMRPGRLTVVNTHPFRSPSRLCRSG